MADFPTSHPHPLAHVDSLATMFDFHDPDVGYEIGAEVIVPQPNKRQGRLKVARAIGSFPVGARLPDDGTLLCPWYLGATCGAAADPILSPCTRPSTALTSSTSRRCCPV